jgi:hypothetical protein
MSVVSGCAILQKIGRIEHPQHHGRPRTWHICVSMETGTDLKRKCPCRFVFGVTAMLPLITAAVAGLVHEERSSHASSSAAGFWDPEAQGNVAEVKGSGGFLKTSKRQLGYLWQTVKEPNIFLPTIFIFLWQATPTSETAMFFFT